MSQRAKASGQAPHKAATPIALSLPSPLSVLFFLAAITSLVLAIADIRESARFADVFLVAERLEQSEQVSPETLARTAANTDAIVADDYCRSDVVMAGATLVLGRLDSADALTDYSAWVKSSDDAERFMRHAVSCMPSESNFWLRLAIVRAVIVQEPKAIARLMTMSARLAPSDEVALLARMYFWNRLHADTLKNAEMSVERDMSLFLSLGDPHKVAPAFASVSPALLPYLEKAGSKLPPDKMALLLTFGVKAFAASRYR